MIFHSPFLLYLCYWYLIEIS